MGKSPVSKPSGSATKAHKLPGQVVLVLQGGGALGAYQGGIYEALHEAGVEPNWVIGTSIGALNAGIIAGNPPDKRLEHLREFWATMEYKPWWEDSPFLAPWFSNSSILADFTSQTAHMMALFGGVAGYYTLNHALTLEAPKPRSASNGPRLQHRRPRKTMTALTDPACFNSGHPRLTVGTVNVKTGRMHYWDSARMPLGLNHVLASAALPLSFPAVRIDGDPYWDGGIYSNTPIEAVFDDNPRRIPSSSPIRCGTSPDPNRSPSRTCSAARRTSSSPAATTATSPASRTFTGSATSSANWSSWFRKTSATGPK